MEKDKNKIDIIGEWEFVKGTDDDNITTKEEFVKNGGKHFGLKFKSNGNVIFKTFKNKKVIKLGSYMVSDEKVKIYYGSKILDAFFEEDMLTIYLGDDESKFYFVKK